MGHLWFLAAGGPAIPHRGTPNDCTKQACETLTLSLNHNPSLWIAIVFGILLVGMWFTWRPKDKAEEDDPTQLS